MPSFPFFLSSCANPTPIRLERGLQSKIAIHSLSEHVRRQGFLLGRGFFVLTRKKERFHFGFYIRAFSLHALAHSVLVLHLLSGSLPGFAHGTEKESVCVREERGQVEYHTCDSPILSTVLQCMLFDVKVQSNTIHVEEEKLVT